MRQAIITAHLLSAWAASAVLVVLSVTGCALVFEKSIDAWIDPALGTVKPGSNRLTLAETIKLATAASGERVTEIHLGALDRSTMAVTERQKRVYVDRYTGLILGVRNGSLPSVRLRQLHKNLLAGRAGEWIVAGATMLLIFQSVSGLYLWWPVKRLSVKTGRGTRRFIFDFHHAMGFYSSLLICVVSVTGLVRFYPGVTDRLFGYVAPAPTLKSSPGPLRISVDDAAARAEKQFVSGQLVRINLPRTDADPFVVSARYPGDMSPFGLSWVNLDQHDGKVLFVQNLHSESAADGAQRIDREIHTGEIAGIGSRAAALLTCLAILAEIGSGMWMWWNRSRASDKPRQRRRKGVSAGVLARVAE